MNKVSVFSLQMMQGDINYCTSTKASLITLLQENILKPLQQFISFSKHTLDFEVIF